MASIAQSMPLKHERGALIAAAEQRGARCVPTMATFVEATAGARARTNDPTIASSGTSAKLEWRRLGICCARGALRWPSRDRRRRSARAAWLGHRGGVGLLNVVGCGIGAGGCGSITSTGVISGI
jgi:hypothetical protein